MMTMQMTCLLLSLFLIACGGATASSTARTVVNGMGPYDELSADEYQIAVERICAHLGLIHLGMGMLADPNKNPARDSETWGDLNRPSLIRTAVEVPPKAKRQTVVERVARVSVHLPEHKLVEEYLVALGSETTGKQVQWVRQIPHHKRPLSLVEADALDDFAARHLAVLEAMIADLYEASFYRAAPTRGQERDPGAQNYCTRGHLTQPTDALSRPFCLFAMPTSPMKTARDAATRSVILRFSRLTVPFNQHPTDIQMQVNITDTNFNNWRRMNFWMQDKWFSSTTKALEDYQRQPQAWRRQPFEQTLPNERKEARTDLPEAARPFSLDEQGMLKEEDPTNSAFPGSVTNKHVQYGEWSFHVSVLRDSGLRFFNITYKSRLMIAEAGLEDTVTMYAADTPFMQRMLSLESMYGVGAMWSELSPGIDCPVGAAYLSVPMVAQPNSGPKTILRGICLYEGHAENYEGASHRFYAFPNPTDSAAAHGVPGYATAAREPSLYVVGITALFNYQYSFVNVFSPGGSISMHVLPTGYVHVERVPAWQQLPLPAAPDERFGYISQVWSLQLMLHTHNYLFFLDLDVLDEKNVAEVVEVAGVNGEEQEPPTEEEDGGGRRRGFASGFGISRNQRRLQYELDDEMEESSGGGGRPIESAKTSRLRRHRICKGKNIIKPCLEVINTASLPSMFSEETTRSYAWVRKGIWINRYHEHELPGSSIYNGVDLTDPVVDFLKFTGNNESMVDKDLVVWANVGFCHIPSNEDIPHTSTHYSTYSVIVKPINFFNAPPQVDVKGPAYTIDNAFQMTAKQEPYLFHRYKPSPPRSALANFPYSSGNYINHNVVFELLDVPDDAPRLDTKGVVFTQDREEWSRGYILSSAEKEPE